MIYNLKRTKTINKDLLYTKTNFYLLTPRKFNCYFKALYFILKTVFIYWQKSRSFLKPNKKPSNERCKGKLYTSNFLTLSRFIQLPKVIAESSTNSSLRQPNTDKKRSQGYKMSLKMRFRF